jgi:hypothetical protein
MKLMSKLQPDTATMTGILTAAGVYLIYQNALPSAADIRTTPANNPDVESARKAAAWKSAALITLVFLVARDLNSYIISGAALVGVDYLYKHSNAIQPGTGTLEGQPMTMASYPLPEYDSESAG